MEMMVVDRDRILYDEDVMSDYIEIPEKPLIHEDAQEAWRIFMDLDVYIESHDRKENRDRDHLLIIQLSDYFFVQTRDYTLRILSIGYPLSFGGFLEEIVFTPLIKCNLLEEAIQIKML